MRPRPALLVVALTVASRFASRCWAVDVPAPALPRSGACVVAPLRGGLVVRRLRRLATVLVVAFGVAAPMAAAQGSSWTIVAGGLDNPRGLGFLANGRLIVAESGHAGDTCVYGGAFCLGLTAQVTSIDLRTGARTSLVSGLGSWFFPFEPFGLGGLSTQGGRIVAVTANNPQLVGSSADACNGQPPPCVSVVNAAVARAGLLISITPGGTWRSLGGVGAYDYQWTIDHHYLDPQNPDWQPGDADPYAVLPGRRGFYVADGGANTLSFVANNGTVSVQAYLPDPPNHQPVYDAVPTCLAKANGAIYIGDLAGELYRWDGTSLTKVLSGGKLTAIVGCTTDQDGNLYVVNLTQAFNEFSPQPGTGSIVKVTPRLTTSYVITPSQGLNYPNGITLGPDGALYLSANSICPADPSILQGLPGIPPGACPDPGQVVRVNDPDLDSSGQ